jgi:hypothetical protein
MFCQVYHLRSFLDLSDLPGLPFSVSKKKHESGVE